MVVIFFARVGETRLLYLTLFFSVFWFAMRLANVASCIVGGFSRNILPSAVKSRGTNLRVHYKHCREIAAAVAGKNLQASIKYLRDVVDHKRIIPFRVHTGGVGRHAQVGTTIARFCSHPDCVPRCYPFLQTIRVVSVWNWPFNMNLCGVGLIVGKTEEKKILACPCVCFEPAELSMLSTFCLVPTNSRLEFI